MWVEVCHISYDSQKGTSKTTVGFRNSENDIRNLKEKESNSTFKIRHSELKKGLEIPKTSCFLNKKTAFGFEIWYLEFVRTIKIQRTAFEIRKNRQAGFGKWHSFKQKSCLYWASDISDGRVTCILLPWNGILLFISSKCSSRVQHTSVNDFQVINNLNGDLEKAYEGKHQVAWFWEQFS